MDRLSLALDQYKAYGLGLLRVAAGLLILNAGYTKFFIEKIPKVIENFDRMGIILPQVTGPFIAGLELAGGALVIVGLFTRYLGLIFVAEFAVAAYTKWVLLGYGMAGARYELLLLVIFLALATNGGGALNLGTLLKRGA